VLKKILSFIMIFIFISTSSLFLFSCQDKAPNQVPEPEAENELVHEESVDNDMYETSEYTDEYVEKPAERQEEKPEMPHIGLYAGKGSWIESVEATKSFLDHYELQWSVFDEEDVLSLDLKEHFDLLWFPGGFAAEYKNMINDHSNIRNFVKEGGLFVGSCAGAYYASDILRWKGTDYQYPLRLFAGKAAGPLSGQIARGQTATFNLEDKHPVNQDFNSTLDMYYFDGPYFDPYNEDSIVVLARYEVNEEPAVIAGRSGSGKYLLLGPHPEIGSYSSQSTDYNREGENTAKWSWLHAALTWLAGWE